MGKDWGNPLQMLGNCYKQSKSTRGSGDPMVTSLQGKKGNSCTWECLSLTGAGFSSRISHIHLLSLTKV